MCSPPCCGSVSIVIDGPHVAWEALKEPQKIEVLVVSAVFGEGMPTGVSLVMHVRFKQGKVHAVLVGDDGSGETLTHHGVVLAANATAAEIAETVSDLIAGSAAKQPG
jgi:hypothetical protein